MGKLKQMLHEKIENEAKVKIEKRVKLFDLEDGTQVVVTKDTDTDADAIVKIKIYTEVKGEVFISFEVPLHCENTEKQNILFNNDQKLKDFAIGVYNSQMSQLDENFKTI
jgi:hypothetical protein